MTLRKIGSSTVTAVGLGCMNYAHGYGNTLTAEAASRLLNEALDLGYTHFDTATIYGAGVSETVLGDTLGARRNTIFLASKCGLYPGTNGAARDIDGRPERIKAACEASLKRLKTDVIDLYYLHRLDKTVPIEESAGAFAELIREGKIRSYGLSEVSAETLRRAHAVHPVAALQSEYSLWTRNPEIATLEACRELGVTFVAFSPLARAFLTGKHGIDAVLHPDDKDMRRSMPRFAPETYAKNLELLGDYGKIAEEVGCSMAELAIAWVLAQGEHVVAIPGTTRVDHLKENFRAGDIRLPKGILSRLDALINQETVAGARYNAAQQADVETETFTSEA